MARRGWVSAEVAPDVWRRLSVFDDGWVELPGFARSLSDTRAQGRSLLRVVALLVVLGAATYAADRLDLPAVVGGVLSAGLLVVLLWSSVLAFRFRLANRRQLVADADQARAEKAQRLRREAGAPLFRRADSARQFAGWIKGEVHVDGATVLGVEAAVEGDLHVVHVRLSTGDVRRYASPDRTLPKLLAPFGEPR